MCHFAWIDYLEIKDYKHDGRYYAKNAYPYNAFLFGF